MERKTIEIIYEPNSRAKLGWIKTWVRLIKNIIESWDLVYQLFKRDFFMSYKKSFLGMAWLVITPIMGILSWVFMDKTGILAPGDVGIPYPAYVLISSSIFGLFMGFFGAASGTLSAGQGFIMQVKFPHDVLLVKQLLQQLAGFIITFIISIIALLFSGVVPSWMIVLFPLMIIPMMLLASAIGLICSVIAVVATDINRGIGFLMGLVMYITPVIYSSKVDNPTLQKIIQYNPLTYLVGCVRDAFIYGKIDHLDRYLISSAASLILFLIAWRVFYISEEKVIEKMI